MEPQSSHSTALRNCVLLALQGIGSLYLDWEDDQETHAERLQAIAAGMSIDIPAGLIHYQRQTNRLHESGRETRMHIATTAAAMSSSTPWAWLQATHSTQAR